QHATSHAIYFQDRVTTLTVNHFNCTIQKIPKSLIPCDDIDVALDTSCPATTKVLDISISFPVRDGDEVVAYGYGKQGNLWRGHVAGQVPNTIAQKVNPFLGQHTVHVDE